MSIPSKMRPTGFDSWYVRLYRDLLELLGSPEKFVLDWIAPEKKLIIHTDRVDDTVLTEVAAIAAELVPVEVDIVQYNHHIEVSWKDINKYVNIRTSKELSEFVTKEEFQNDLTSDGRWVYPMPEFTGTFGWYSMPTAGWFRANPKLRYVEFYAPKSHISIGWFSPNSNLKEVWCEVGHGYDANSFFSSCPNLKKITAIFPECTTLNNLCSGCKNLEDVDISFKDATTGNGFYFENIFRGCILNKVSVLRFVDRLPDSSKAYQNKTMMTLGIDVNLQNDEEVWTAIHDAEAKGWKLTVQWNPGGPTYTTPAT